MPYFIIEDFKGGLDSRKSAVTGLAGTLMVLENADITRGGEISQRLALVEVADLPTGTEGLAIVDSVQYVFGSGAEPSGMPDGYTYVQIASPTASDLVKIRDTEVFDKKIYVIAEYEDGEVHHFYDGELLKDWSGKDTAADVAQAIAEEIEEDEVVTVSVTDSTMTFTGIEDGPIDISASGVGVTVTETTEGHDGVDGAYATGEVVYSMTAQDALNEVSTLTVGGNAIIASAIDCSGASTAYEVALLVAAAVDHDDYTASASWVGDSSTGKVVISTVEHTDAFNGESIVSTVAGELSVTGGALSDQGEEDVAGVNQVTTVEFVDGEFKPYSSFTIEVGDTTYRKGTRPGAGQAVSVFAHESKVYVIDGSILSFCSLNDPTAWDNESVGAGLLNLSTEAGQEDLTGLSVYNNLLAIFSENTSQLWSMDADDAANIKTQILRNSGSIAPRSVVPFGGMDVYYLSLSGIRSLRAKDVSVDAANVADVGTAIDTDVSDYISTLTEEEVANAVAAFEPKNARYILAIGTRAYVFSYFPGSKISAWSTYILDEVISDIVVDGPRFYVRSGDKILLLGGETGLEKDDVTVKVRTPFLDFGKPATKKELLYLDIAASGEWHVVVYPNPNNDTISIDCGTIGGVSYPEPATDINGESTHFSIELTSSTAPVALYNMTFHYKETGSRLD